MPWSPKARCYKCNRQEALKSSLCQSCRNTYYGREYRRLKAVVLLNWIAEHGHVCPGHERDMHKVALRDLTVDHRVPISRGGRTELRNLGVLCLRCNSAKAGHA